MADNPKEAAKMVVEMVGKAPVWRQRRVRLIADRAAVVV
jgi:hypothetical protein